MSTKPIEVVSLNKKKRFQIFERDHFMCQNCGATNTRLEVGLLVPRAQGGTESDSNLRTVCRGCVDPRFSLIQAVMESRVDNPAKTAAIVLETLRRGIHFRPELSQKLWSLELKFRQEAKEVDHLSGREYSKRIGAIGPDFEERDQAAYTQFHFVADLDAERIAAVVKP